MRTAVCVTALAALMVFAAGCGRGPALPFREAAKEAEAQLEAAMAQPPADVRPVAVETPQRRVVDAVIVYDDHERRDPFVAPPRVTEPDVDKQHATLELEMVIQGGERPIAVISGERVTEGDSVQGCTVKEIASGRVVLEFEGETFEITAN